MLDAGSELPVMNITVFNPLSGETTIVTLLQGASLSTFETLLYREVIPDAPIGCITYRRMDYAIDEGSKEIQEEMQLLRLGDVYVNHPDQVTVLFDGLEVIAFVDESVLFPFIEANFPVSLIHSKNWVKLLDTYIICFHYRGGKMSKDDSNFVSSIDVFHDVDADQWALATSFAKTHDLHCRSYYSGNGAPYTATPSTQWFSSLSECIAHSTERIPKDSALLEECNAHIQQNNVHYNYTHNKYGTDGDYY
jgi:hypothetical protein